MSSTEDLAREAGLSPERIERGVMRKSLDFLCRRHQLGEDDGPESAGWSCRQRAAGGSFVH